MSQRRRIQLADFPGGFAPIHNGHLDIHQDQAILPRQGVFDFFYGNFAVFSRFYDKSQAAEYFRFDFQVNFIVLHQEDFIIHQLGNGVGRIVHGLHWDILQAEAEDKGEGAAFPRRTLCLNFPAHHFCQAAGNRKPKTRAVDAAERGILLPFKGFKDMFQEVCADPNAGVLD